MSTKNTTITLHRVLKADPDKVFRAFTDAKALASWLPPYGFLGEVHRLDARVGGSYKMSFTNFTTGKVQSFEGNYLEVETNAFIKHTDTFDDPNLPGEIITSIWFRKVSTGTDLTIVQEGTPELIPADMCYLGWQDSLDKLIRLVEPVIKD